MARYLETIWHLETEDGHMVSVTHRDIEVDDAEHASQIEREVRSMTLAADGTLTYKRDGTTFAVREADVEIHVDARPGFARAQGLKHDARGGDRRRRNGRDPGEPSYSGAQMTACDIGLAALAGMPGARKRMTSVAYGLTT